MHVVHHAYLPRQGSGGDRRLSAADRSLGVQAFEIVIQAIEAGVQTPAQWHAGELVVLALAGAGKLLIDGGPQRFTAPCTLLIPPGQAFQFVNNGTATLQLVWVSTQAPMPISPATAPGEPAP